MAITMPELDLLPDVPRPRRPYEVLGWVPRSEERPLEPSGWIPAPEVTAAFTAELTLFRVVVLERDDAGAMEVGRELVLQSLEGACPQGTRWEVRAL